eukprot:Colp12_sorted_trinity150504_noHs@16526
MISNGVTSICFASWRSVGKNISIYGLHFPEQHVWCASQMLTSQGCSAVSIGENVIYYPFYLLKTREQVDRTRGVNTFLQSLNTSRQILIKEGIQGFYKGFWTCSIASLPSFAVYFVSYKYLKHKVEEIFGKEKASLYSPFFAGTCADILSNTIYVPVEVVVQRLQLKDKDPRYLTTRSTISTIWREEGFKGFYTGFGATTLTYGIASGVWWSTYEGSKKQLLRGLG